MIKSECLECQKIYDEVDNGKKKIEISHGYCPKCLDKIRTNNKKRREKKNENMP